MVRSHSDRMNHKGSGFVGHPAIIFWLMNDYGRDGASNMTNLIVLDKWLFNLDAYLSVKLDPAEYDKGFVSDVNEVMGLLNAAWTDYQPEFEGTDFNPSEKGFVMGLRDIYWKLVHITARGRVVEHIEYDLGGSEGVP